jgi:hypothetical protein
MTSRRPRFDRSDDRMLLERRTVSRKTPNDGRLEITKVAATKCEPLGTSFHVELGEVHARARLGAMKCTCRGVDNPHVHYFIESEAFKQLAPGDEIDLELDAPHKTIRVSRPS